MKLNQHMTNLQTLASYILVIMMVLLSTVVVSARGVSSEMTLDNMTWMLMYLWRC